MWQKRIQERRLSAKNRLEATFICSMVVNLPGKHGGWLGSHFKNSLQCPRTHGNSLLQDIVGNLE